MSTNDKQNTESESSWFENLGHEIKQISEDTWYTLKENLEWLGGNIKSGTLKVLDNLETFLRDGDSKDIECNCEPVANNHEANNHLDSPPHQYFL